MAPFSVQLPALRLPALKPDEAKLVGALAAGAVASGAVYLLIRRAGRAAPAVVEVTTLEELRAYARGGALRDAAAWLFAPTVTAVRVTGHGARVPSLPRALCSLKAMRELSVAGNALTELPRELGALAALRSLDVSHNLLAALPEDLGGLTALTSLNAMGNRLEALPESMGALAALRRLGLKGNRLRRLPPSVGRLGQLQELFLTDNALEALPAELGACASLAKLQASHNPALAALPAELAALPALELLRVACCAIEEVPPALGAAPALAWLSLAGNPVCARAAPRRGAAPAVAMEELEMGRKLGDGASGEVFEAWWRGRRVAAKLFRADLGPDGRTADEVALAVALSDRHLVRVLGVLGGAQQPAAAGGLVLEFVEGAVLAAKPTSESLLRCRWPEGAALELPWVLRVATGVAAALEHMHTRGAAHGDVYAHNVLADAEGNAVLCDYGAAFFYARSSPLAAAYEGQDARAFGLFLRDLVARVDIGFDGLEAALDAQKQLLLLAAQCTTGPPARRPRFGAVRRKLAALQKAAGRGAGGTPRSDSRLAVREAGPGDAREGYATTR